MSTLTRDVAPDHTPRQRRPSANHALAALLAFEGLLILVPTAVLGAAIDWPAGLDAPAAEVLPQLIANQAGVRTGYLVYLLYSVLFLPVAIMTTWVLTRGAAGPLARLAVGFAIASTVARVIGILRWLTAMPVLAEAWQSADGTAERRAIELDYDVLNSFGGGIGELLGVALFAAAWLACTTAAAARAGGASRGLLVLTGTAAILVGLPLVELAGIPSGPLVAIGTVAMSIALITIAVSLIRGSRTRGGPSGATGALRGVGA